jgi:hypothetical protein
MAETQTHNQAVPPAIAAPRTDRDLLQEILDAQKPLTPTKLSMETIEGFEAIQRAARLLSASSLVPDVYKGNLPNCTIAMNMASRLGADPLMIMQNLYIVHGKPGWSSQFYIAAFNSCGRFTPIHYRYIGEEGKDSWGCIAWAKERETGEIVEGPKITISMAKAEGWYAKNGSKWQTMPQLMLDYRSASFLVRTVAPELTMGLKTVEEIRDGDVTEEELSTPTVAPIATPEPAPGATTTGRIKGKLAAREKPSAPPAEQEPKVEPPSGAKLAEAAEVSRSRNARIAAIRDEAKERHGEHFMHAWADACQECAGGKPSTQWSEKEILDVTDYLSRWRSFPVEDSTGVDPTAAAILTGEREPGEEG